MTRQTDNWRKRNQGDHVVNCVFKKGGQHLGRDGSECRLSLTQAPWPQPVPGTQSWALLEPRHLDFAFQGQMLQFKNWVSCLPHLLCSYLWKWRACSSRLIVLIQVYSSNFPASKIFFFFFKIRPVCQTVQLILPGRFEKISELQMGPHRFQWKWVFQQVWITVIKNLFQG